jgi:hypothetical protein
MKNIFHLFACFFLVASAFAQQTTFGCTDSTAFNYNPDALYDDASCIEIVYGCTYDLPSICNFDSNANVDDGSCFYVDSNEDCIEPQPSTCLDVFASNFNEEATCSYYNTYPIEDAGFLNYLLENYPGCMVNDSLNLDALGGITNLNLDGLNISSIDGIQYFTDLVSVQYP